MAVDLNQNKPKKKSFLKQFEERFDRVDLDNDGYLTFDEIMTWPKKLSELSGVTSEEIDTFRGCLTEFWAAIGLAPDKKLDKKEFVKGLAKLAEADISRKRAGTQTLYEKLHNSLFDVTDSNKDGKLSWEEVKIMEKTFPGLDRDEDVEKLFKEADKDKNGEIDRKEFIDLKFKFWFNPVEG